MSSRFISFIAFVWFVSTLICLVLEGGDFAMTATSISGSTISGTGGIINDMAAIQQLSISNLIGIPSALLTFTRGLFRMMIWDYSFYTGGFAIMRWFWLAIFSTAAVWGITTTFVNVFANFLRIR